MTEFIPTLGNMIKEMDKIIITIPPYLRIDYAKLFCGTEIQKLLIEFDKKKSPPSPL